MSAGACGSSITPTPPPTEDPPKITCPAPQTVQLTTGSSIAVAYAATTINGRAPVTIVCVPPSGSVFGIGQKTIVCTATDALQRTDTCSVAITVLAPPALAVTRFLAFGDSITRGEDGVNGVPQPQPYCPIPTSTSTSLQMRFGPRTILPDAQTYPGVLQQKLIARYTTQSPMVTNRGCPGESVTATNPDTFSRFVGLASSGAYDAVLIMEGSNDLDAAAQAAPSVQIGVLGSTAAGLRQMVDNARRLGLYPLLATIPPMSSAGSRGGGARLVPLLNERILQIGGAENIPIVDVYAAFKGDLTLLGDDGLHPNVNGYAVIATTFADAIKSTLEIKTALTSPTSPRSSRIDTSRRSPRAPR